MSSMSEKLVSQDEDEDIRHTFMAFDVQCKLNKIKHIFCPINSNGQSKNQISFGKKDCRQKV